MTSAHTANQRHGNLSLSLARLIALCACVRACVRVCQLVVS